MHWRTKRTIGTTVFVASLLLIAAAGLYYGFNVLRFGFSDAGWHTPEWVDYVFGVGWIALVLCFGGVFDDSHPSFDA